MVLIPYNAIKILESYTLHRLNICYFIGILLLGNSIWAQKIGETSFELIDNVIFIKGSINGSGSLNFMFDSGAGTTILNSSAAAALNLEYSGESRIGTSGGVLISKSAPGNPVEIGKVTLPQITLEVIPLDHLSGYFKIAVDAIIGYDLFERLILWVDADKKTISIYESTQTIDLTKWQEIPLHRVDNRKAGVEISFLSPGGGDTKNIVVVDTGNPDEIHLFPNAIEVDNIALTIRKKKVRGFSADSTITENQRGTIKEIRFAGQKWRNVKTVLPTDSLSRAAFSDNESYGLIGQGLLLDFNMIYDYPGNHFYFQKRN